MNLSEIIETHYETIESLKSTGKTWDEIALTLTSLINVNVNATSLKTVWSRRKTQPKVAVNVDDIDTSAELKNAENIISSLKKDIDELKSEISVLNAKMMELIKENEDLKSRKHNPPDAQPYLQKNTRTIPTDEFDEIAVEPNEPNEPKPEIKKLNSGLSFIEIITGVKK